MSIASHRIAILGTVMLVPANAKLNPDNGS